MSPIGLPSIGAMATDAATPREDLWFTYPLTGNPPLEIRLAQEPMADPVTVQVMGTEAPPERLAIQIETTVSIFNSFDLRCPGFA